MATKDIVDNLKIGLHQLPKDALERLLTGALKEDPELLTKSECIISEDLDHKKRY